MLKHRKYKNPPAIEVLFEVHFSEIQSNLTLFGDFYHKIKTDYPRKNTLRNIWAGNEFCTRCCPNETANPRQYDEVF